MSPLFALPWGPAASEEPVEDTVVCPESTDDSCQTLVPEDREPTPQETRAKVLVRHRNTLRNFRFFCSEVYVRKYLWPRDTPVPTGPRRWQDDLWCDLIELVLREQPWVDEMEEYATYCTRHELGNSLRI